MKKLALVLSAALVISFAFTACGTKEAPSSVPSGSKSSSGISTASNSDFPKRSVEMVIPFGAGSASDTFAREYAQIASKYLGKPINCVNMGGAGTVQGMTYVYNAPADGYTILEVTPSLLIKELLKASSIKFRQEFEPLLRVQSDVQLFGVSSSSQFKTLDDLLNYAKKNPGKLKIGGISPGGLDQFIADGFAKKAGISWTYVPYNSGSENKAAVLGNELDVYQNKMIDFLPLVQSGKIRPLVVLNDTKLNIPGLENCVASKEAGIDFTQGSWRGFVAKKGTPKDVCAALISALQKAYQDPQYKKLEESQMTNIRPGHMEAKEWKADWDSEYNQFEDVFKSIGLLNVK